MAAQLREADDVGFVPLKRRFFNHPFWKEKRVFSKAEAWLDMIQTARFEESEAMTIAGNRKISWKRGQLPASVRFIATRWQWGKHKVETFLTFLEDEKMILRHTDDGQTIITLLKYEEHNKKGDKQTEQNEPPDGFSGNSKSTIEKRGQQRGQKRGQQNEPPEPITSAAGDSSGDTNGDKAGTARGQHGDKTNNVNKENKDNKGDTGAGAPPSIDEKKFKDFEQWILKWAPRVAKMEKPFSLNEYITIKKEIDQKVLSDILRKMHNWKPLLKKNVSAYLTALNWTKMDEERHPGKNQNGIINGSANKQGEKIAAAIQTIESKRQAG